MLKGYEAFRLASPWPGELALRTCPDNSQQTITALTSRFLPWKLSLSLPRYSLDMQYNVLYEPPDHFGVHCAPMFPGLIPVDTSARPRPSSSTSWRCGCSSTGSSSARSCPSTPRVPSVDQSTSSRPARPRSSPPRRPGPSSTASTSRRWWAFAREPLSDMPVDRLAQLVARRHHASALMGFGGEREPARGDRARDVGRSRVPRLRVLGKRRRRGRNRDLHRERRGRASP